MRILFLSITQKCVYFSLVRGHRQKLHLMKGNINYGKHLLTDVITYLMR